uniref:Uncharacterized protein n=1 Tax=Anguilla anguilla TaxID=7936 RepID=A0A0E9Q1P1_ANGAN
MHLLVNKLITLIAFGLKKFAMCKSAER